MRKNPSIGIVTLLAALAAACSNSTTSPSALPGGLAGSSSERVSTQSIADLPPIGQVAGPPSAQPTCTSGTTVPTANPNNGKVDIEWRRLVNAVGYDGKIEKLQVNNLYGPLVTFRTYGNASVFHDLRLVAGKYQVSIQGRFAGGCVGPWGKPFQFTVDGPNEEDKGILANQDVQAE